MARRLASYLRIPCIGLGLLLTAPACLMPLLDVGQVDVEAPSRIYPAWEGTDRDLFADGVDPVAVGLALDVSPVPPDGSLQARVQLADAIAKVRITTVTAEQTGEVSVYRFGVEVIRAFGDPMSVRSAFELTVGKEAAAYQVAKTMEARLRGKQFIGFFRRFASGPSESALHWHLSSDAPEVEDAVKEALALKELQAR